MFIRNTLFLLAFILYSDKASSESPVVIDNVVDEKISSVEPPASRAGFGCLVTYLSNCNVIDLAEVTRRDVFDLATGDYIQMTSQLGQMTLPSNEQLVKLEKLYISRKLVNKISVIALTGESKTFLSCDAPYLRQLDRCLGEIGELARTNND